MVIILLLLMASNFQQASSGLFSREQHRSQRAEAGETAPTNAKTATFKQVHIIIWGPVQTQRVGNRICCNKRDIVDIFEKQFTGWLKVTEMHYIKQ